jgi:uncharacterized low-complexity protein
VVDLHDAANGFTDDGSSIVLAIVKLQGDGSGLELLFSRHENIQRRVAGQTVGELRINRSQDLGGEVQETPAGVVGTSDQGHLRIASESGELLLSGNAEVERDLTCHGTIRGNLAENLVDSQQIVNGSVQTAELANGSVTAEKVAANAVGSAQLQNSSVTASKIKDGQVGTNELANNAVTSAKIKDGNVGTNELANSAVTSAKIKDGNVGTNELAKNAVTSAKIAPRQVGTDELANNSVSDGKLRKQGHFTIRCHDLWIGDVRGRAGRALVDDRQGGTHALVVNYGAHWRTCVVNNFAAGSSRTLKTDIKTMSLKTAEAIIGALTPRTFRYRNNDDRQERLGFVAEESPDAVTESGKQGVFLDGILASLVLVVNDLRKQIERLESRRAGDGENDSA